MNIIKELEKGYEPPEYAHILKPFPRRRVAEKVGVSTGFLCNVLTGSKEPSKVLEKRLIRLAEQVLSEMAIK